MYAFLNWLIILTNLTLTLRWRGTGKMGIVVGIFIYAIVPSFHLRSSNLFQAI